KDSPGLAIPAPSGRCRNDIVFPFRLVVLVDGVGRALGHRRRGAGGRAWRIARSAAHCSTAGSRHLSNKGESGPVDWQRNSARGNDAVVMGQAVQPPPVWRSV
ncbi:MAG: hypothetical protein ACKOJF_36070, partial [Planctomycetaceae bacterium]